MFAFMSEGLYGGARGFGGFLYFLKIIKDNKNIKLINFYL